MILTAPVTKRCRDCKEVKPLADFPPDKSKKDGCSPSCNLCWKVKYRAREQMPKRCIDCKQVKPVSEFYQDKKWSWVYELRCKLCYDARQWKNEHERKVCPICGVEQLLSEFDPRSPVSEDNSDRCRRCKDDWRWRRETETLVCSTCGEKKLLRDIWCEWSDSHTRHPLCLACKVLRDKKRKRETSRKFAKDHPDKMKAERIMQAAVRNGKVIRPDRCEMCGELARVQGHHPDHSKPEQVVWLCPSHHGRAHHGWYVKRIAEILRERYGISQLTFLEREQEVG